MKTPDNLNARQRRAIGALLSGPKTRVELWPIVGALNMSQTICELRKKGLEIECPRVDKVDMDGKACHPGLYSLTERDRIMLAAWGWVVE